MPLQISDSETVVRLACQKKKVLCYTTYGWPRRQYATLGGALVVPWSTRGIRQDDDQLTNVNNQLQVRDVPTHGCFDNHPLIIDPEKHVEQCRNMEGRRMPYEYILKT